MGIKKILRAFIGANVMLLMTFAFLPVLIFNPDVELLTNVINYINKD
ncbi:MAG TPA: hypothetical protein K8V56_01730 [Sporosarcina psychrophila]|uniref:Uncharacterized protein n=1 Tax=Sporosarcina psychrophila TaxID=1476 RepID=A0A921FWX8_SPOPS|nr:hypothetical protein [Sporosarcina psychrophila]